MTKPTLARLQRVELRTYWEREDTEFTPWLAQDDNIALLGEAIGIALEVEQQEANVGPFRADILCRNTDDDSLVLIENQLERTNHRHLGQILTYAAGLDASTVVWIAQEFTEEHRSAIDWLNEISHEGLNFFGIVIELWRIGDSPAAPQFRIVARPNDWSRTVRERSRGASASSETKQLYLEFWTAFQEHLQSHQSPIRLSTPMPRPFERFKIGRAGFGMRAKARAQQGTMSVYLRVSGRNKEAHFGLLLRDREAIERELGFPLEWAPDGEASSAHIRIVLDEPTASFTDRSRWGQLHEWTRTHLEAFQRVFGPRIAELDASAWDEA